MRHVVFEAKSETDTERLGQLLAEALPAGTTVGLIGTLGSGKTRLVKAVAQACGIDPHSVISPTFVLMQPYVGRRTLYHFDVYRLGAVDEFVELGPEECFESESLTFVEWADRVADALPDERIEIRIEATGATERRFEIAGYRTRGEIAISRLEQMLEQM